LWVACFAEFDLEISFNLLFFFVGLCILTPTAVLLVDTLWEGAFSPTSPLPSWLKFPETFWLVPAASAEQCTLIEKNDIGYIYEYDKENFWIDNKDIITIDNIII
jgi:hypothetical protein